MAEVAGNFTTGILETYNSFISSLPPVSQNFINLFLLVLLVVIYVVFIWKFYRFVSKKNMFKLNLAQYNKYENTFFAKILNGILYLAEYIIVLPFLIFFWFSVFTIFLTFLTETLEIKTILLISAMIIAAIRMTSYYKEELSRELAKLLPFTLLALSLSNPKFFNIERIFGQLNSLPEFFSQIMYYFIFIIALETLLRFFEFIFSLFGLGERPETQEEETEEEQEEIEET